MYGYTPHANVQQVSKKHEATHRTQALYTSKFNSLPLKITGALKTKASRALRIFTKFQPNVPDNWKSSCNIADLRKKTRTECENKEMTWGVDPGAWFLLGQGHDADVWNEEEGKYSLKYSPFYFEIVAKTACACCCSYLDLIVVELFFYFSIGTFLNTLWTTLEINLFDFGSAILPPFLGVG